jgi:DNA-binding beta-propeller fold protein YncE
MVLKRLDPRSGEEVASITLEGFFTNEMDVAVGAGSVWVSSADGFADAVLKVDPEAGRVVDRMPVPAESPPAWPSGTVRCGSRSSGRGTLSRVDPRTGEVAGEIEVGRGATGVAVDRGSGAVWVASGSFFLGEDSENNKLSRVEARRPTEWWRRCR